MKKTCVLQAAAVRCVLDGEMKSKTEIKSQLVRRLAPKRIKWKLPDGTLLEESATDFARRGFYRPYFPLYVTPPVNPAASHAGS